MQNAERILKRECVPSVLDVYVQKFSVVWSAVHGFPSCGLCPWNPENRDFWKCRIKLWELNLLHLKLREEGSKAVSAL